MRVSPGYAGRCKLLKMSQAWRASVDGCYWIGLSGFGESQLTSAFSLWSHETVGGIPLCGMYLSANHHVGLHPPVASRRVVDANRRGIITSRGRKSRGFIPLIGTTVRDLRSADLHSRVFRLSRARATRSYRETYVKVVFEAAESRRLIAMREGISRWPEYIRRISITVLKICVWTR